MKSFTVLFFAAFLALGHAPKAFSFCAAQLTQEHSQDSTLFSFSFDDIDQWATDRQLSYGAGDLESAKSALTYLYESLYCQKAPEVDLKQSACSQVKMGRLFSTKCYLETEEGYFFVHQDLLDQVHLHFHRWD